MTTRSWSTRAIRAIPTIRRAEALAAIMRGKRGIIIAGMHGKTTTSAMAAHVLRGGGLHPSHYVGAEIPILGSNAHWDPLGEYFVAEGDESDGTLRFFSRNTRSSSTSRKSISIITRTSPRSRRCFTQAARPDQRHGFLLRRRSACAADLRLACKSRFPLVSANAARLSWRPRSS